MNKYKVPSVMGEIVRSYGTMMMFGIWAYKLIKMAVSEALTDDITTKSYYSAASNIEFIRK